MEIDPEYRRFLTINTHRGLYTYNRLPPGVKIAPTAFQQLMDGMLSGIRGVSVYLDDIIIGGPSESEQDAAVVGVLKRIQSYGFTLRAEKCSFRVDQIKIRVTSSIAMDSALIRRRLKLYASFPNRLI